MKKLLLLPLLLLVLTGCGQEKQIEPPVEDSEFYIACESLRSTSDSDTIKCAENGDVLIETEYIYNRSIDTVEHGFTTRLYHPEKVSVVESGEITGVKKYTTTYVWYSATEKKQIVREITNLYIPAQFIESHTH